MPEANTNYHLPTDPKERKRTPLWSGLVKYFPDALVAVAQLSQKGNDQHNPGQTLHWSRGKSDDHEDTLLRHLWDSGTVDTDGIRHSTKVAWRALALLQLEIEKAEKANNNEGHQVSQQSQHEQFLDGIKFYNEAHKRLQSIGHDRELRSHIPQ